MAMIKQPGSRSCFVCGVENPVGLHMNFYEASPGEIQAEITVPEQYQGYPGVVHGGIIATMLDEATGRSMMGDDPNRFMYTAQLSIRYRKPVPTGKPLRILGHAGVRKGRVAHATGEIYGPDGALLAQADAVLMDIPEETFQGIDPDLLGWKVYPDREAPQ